MLPDVNFRIDRGESAQDLRLLAGGDRLARWNTLRDTDAHGLPMALDSRLGHGSGAPSDGESAATVALIITTHNRSEYLEQSVRSAKAQTYPHVEIVVSDDGSTSPDLLVLLRRLEDEGIEVLRHAPGGIGASLNAAVQAVNTTYIMRLDDDDLIDPAYIEEAVRAAESDPSIGLVYCRATMFGALEGRWELPDVDIGTLLFDNLVFASALVRRADWLEVGGYDETMREGREDHDFVLRIIGLGRRTERLDGTYFHYRQHSSDSVNARVGASRDALVRAHASIFRNNSGLYLEHAEEFWSRIFAQTDQINNLRHRYAFLERMRHAHPRLARAVRRARRLSRSARARLQSRSR